MAPAGPNVDLLRDPDLHKLTNPPRATSVGIPTRVPGYPRTRLRITTQAQVYCPYTVPTIRVHFSEFPVPGSVPRNVTRVSAIPLCYAPTNSNGTANHLQVPPAGAPLSSPRVRVRAMPLNWNEYQAAQSQQHYPPGVIVSAPSSSQGVPVHSAPVISAPVAKPAAVTSTPAKAAAPTVSSTSSSSSSIPDNIDIRELGKRWAISQGFTQDKLMEFDQVNSAFCLRICYAIPETDTVDGAPRDQLMGLVTSTYISSQRVINIQVRLQRIPAGLHARCSLAGIEI
eukprot:1056644-Rhodomonas_salina.3